MAQAIFQAVARCMEDLARIDRLTPDVVRAAAQLGGLSVASGKQLLKATLQSVTTYRARTQFGRLRATLLAGVTLLGSVFLTEVERTGVLLSDDSEPKKFREFLAKLESDADTCHEWSFLRDRLATYHAYEQLASVVTRDKDKIEPLLKTGPRDAVKNLLALTQLCFLRHFLQFEVSSELEEWFDELGTPEELASIASLLVVLANEYQLLDSADFAFPLTSHLTTPEMRKLVEYGRIAVARHEIAKNISLFGYRLEMFDVGRRVFYLRPPSAEFEYAMRLGFIRSEMGTQKAILETNTKAGIPRFSLLGAAELFVSGYHDYVCDLRDQGTPLRRVRLRLPLAKQLYARVMDGGFYEDFSYLERLGQDFLVPLRRQKESEIPLTDDIDLESFVRIWRFFQFFCFVDICVLLPFAKSDLTILCNSLVRIAKEKDIIGMMTEIGIDANKANEFLRLVVADVHHLGYFDLQYRPFLRIATATVDDFTSPPEILHLSALVGLSNVLRNVQSSNKLRLATNAELFAEAVAEALKSRFKKVTTNRRIKAKGENTDIDVIVFEGARLYIFECKHSLPPTGPHEMRDVWEDVEKAVRQLSAALKVLHDPKRLHDYVTGWFPGTTSEQTAGLEIVPCVLCSHRIFAGLSQNGIPIRDFSSLSKLLDDGIVGLGTAHEEEATMYRFRLVDQKGFSAADLDDYVDAESRYFKMFLPFMHPMSRVEFLRDLTVARETYTYEVELEAWLQHMGSIGCERQPDEHRKFTPPWSREELLARMEEGEKPRTSGEKERNQ